MLLGEECRVEAAACHCFGDAGLPGKVPGGQRLVLDMALREVHPVDDLPVRVSPRAIVHSAAGGGAVL